MNICRCKSSSSSSSWKEGIRCQVDFVAAPSLPALATAKRKGVAAFSFFFNNKLFIYFSVCLFLCSSSSKLVFVFAATNVHFAAAKFSGCNSRCVAGTAHALNPSLHTWALRPIAHWRRFTIRRPTSMPDDSADTLPTRTLATHVRSSSARAVP